MTTANHLDEQIAELQDQILDRWGATEAELGPLFYKLRVAMKSQGSRKGLGFTAWLAEHEIPRTTAIRWADNYAVRIGRKEPPSAIEPTVPMDFVPNGTKSEADEMDDSAPPTIPNPKYVRLVYSEAQHTEFCRYESALRPHFGTNNASVTVLAALAELHAIWCRKPRLLPADCNPASQPAVGGEQCA